MTVYEAVTVDGGWAEVSLLDFVVVHGKVLAVVAAPDGTVQTVPLKELRTRQRPNPKQWTHTSTGPRHIVDARAQGTRYFDL